MTVTEAPRKALLTALLAGSIVLLLGTASIRLRSQLEYEQSRESAGGNLADLAGRFQAEIADNLALLQAAARSADTAELAVDRLTSSAYPVWWSDGQDLRFIGNVAPNLYVDSVIPIIESGPSRLVGPVTSADGRDFLLLCVPLSQASDGMRIGMALDLNALWDSIGLPDLIAGGMDARISSDSGQPVYWTKPEALIDPVSTRIDLFDRTWSIAAEPTQGWVRWTPILSGIATILVLALGFAVASWRLCVSPRELESELAEARRRLQGKDNELSELLRSRSHLETQLADSLTIDFNTGLPNRTSFVQNLQSMLATARLESTGVVVATIQLAKFEGLSQSVGASVAQQVIAEAAEKLRDTLSSGEFLGRVGEKELAICSSVPGVPAYEAFAERLLSAVTDRFSIGHREYFSPAVVGLAASLEGFDHGPELLAQSSLAATTASEDGCRWALFRQETKDERVSVLQLEADLQSAIDRGELRLHFQPIVSVAEGNIVGLESLLRWHHPTASWIGPDRFLPLAESMGQMPRISQWVIRQAVAYARQWLGLREAPFYITINLTPRDLNRETFNMLFALLEESELPPDCIRVEVTETAIVRDFRVAGRLLGELNGRGIRVLLDDFGTGYSSLSYLRDLPFHAVKIDKSFIQTMTFEARDFGLVKSIVELVHYLGMECVAEGIELQEQLDLVGMINCDYGQGFLFSKPLSPSEIERLLTDGPVLSRRAQAS